MLACSWHWVSQATNPALPTYLQHDPNFLSFEGSPLQQFGSHCLKLTPRSVLFRLISSRCEAIGLCSGACTILFTSSPGGMVCFDCPLSCYNLFCLHTGTVAARSWGPV